MINEKAAEIRNFDKLNEILIEIVRQIALKRALKEVDKNPLQNFWRLIHGNCFEQANKSWCKIFASKNDSTYWKKFINEENHSQFHEELLTSLKITTEQWNYYVEQMKHYRDKINVHSDMDIKKGWGYSVLDIALQSTCFFYKQLRLQYKVGVNFKIINDIENLEKYYDSEKIQYYEIAKVACNATKSKFYN